MTSRCPRSALVAALILLPLLLASAGCGDQESAAGLEVKIPVRVEQAGRGDIAEYLSTTGTVRAVREVQLDAPITGYLTLGRRGGEGRRLVEGDPVKEGQVIALLDSEETRVNKKSGIDARRAELQKAKSDYERYRRLYDEGFVSEQELKNYESTLATAQYNYDNTLIVEEQTRITAPISGRLTWLTREVDGAKINAGEELAEVMDFSQVVADLELPGGDIARVKEGMAVKVSNYAYPDRVFEGTVRYISPTIRAQSRTFRVEVLLSNKEGLIRPGMFVKADIVTRSHENALVLPRHAVVIRNNRPAVFVVSRQKAEMREVVTGIEDEEQIEILSGIEEGERVVVQGYETLKDKTPVKVNS
jgi:RND family efflux transporter MFP subunit